MPISRYFPRVTLGLPSFEQGDKVKLDLNRLDLTEKTDTPAQVSGAGKVKIAL